MSDDIRAIHDNVLNNGIRERNILTSMCLPFDLNDPNIINMMETALHSGDHRIRLSEAMDNDLKLDYAADGDPVSAAISKFKAIATARYMEEVVACATPLYDNVFASLKSDERKYGILIKDAAPTYGSLPEFVLVSFRGDLYNARDSFMVYQGVSRVIGNDVLFIVSHFDGPEHRYPDQCIKVTVFQKPNTFEFESYMYAIKSLQINVEVQRLLFPTDAFVTHHNEWNKYKFEDIQKSGFVPNDRQLRAITEMDLHRNGKPFILWGPPGTGKTITTVNFVVEKIRKMKGAKFLICTSSNKAADVFTQQALTVLNADKIRRLKSPRREVWSSTVTFTQEETMTVDGEEKKVRKYYIPILDELRPFNVIVSTCATCMRLKDLGDKYFDYIIFDEAGEISELLSLVPISFFYHASCHVFFVGDPHQLGPIEVSEALLSNSAYVTDVSTISRLYKMEAFVGNSNLMVVLNENYRSHKDVMDLYSEVFYDGMLVSRKASTPQEEAYNAKLAQILDNQVTPLRFQTYFGRFQQMLDQSYFNMHEVGLVERYITLARTNKIPFEDIIVIAPYKEQVIRLKHALDSKIDINTVEHCQGSERNLVIFSCVRTDGIGFLSDYRRLNTALSRAKKMLIIIGHGLNLMSDDSFYDVIKHLHIKHDAIFADSLVDKHSIIKLFLPAEA